MGRFVWSLRHRLRTGHWPDVFELGFAFKCARCDFGSPRTRRVRPMALAPLPWS
jgi:hypothetical protein